MQPYIEDTDFVLYCGDVFEVLRTMPDQSIDCCITSPPYFGLRDYGTGFWEGGDPDCAHSVGGQVEDNKAPGAITTGVRPGVDASRCRKCGARRIDQQIGLEPTPAAYVERIVEVFREVRRVLVDEGTVWLNLGDSYAGSNRGGAVSDEAYARLQGDTTKAIQEGGSRPAIQQMDRCPDIPPGLKPKDLVGIPWRVALALQEDGWYLRSDIIWAKPNPLPESVRDRPTKSHEYIFLLSKNPHYYFDQESVREPAEWARWGDQTTPKYEGTDTATGWIKPKTKAELMNLRRSSYKPGQTSGNTLDGHAGKSDAGFPVNENGTKNIRSVWTIPTQSYSEAHFASWPEELVRRCLLAGCPEGGTVLDPFMGSGTTAKVARDHQRHSIGIDLSEKYCALAARRLQQLSLFA